MDSVFTQTTVVLTAEYVELFTPEQLRSRLSKVSQLTGVQFSQAKTIYALTGSWEQVNSAFDLLQDWRDNPGRESTENEGCPEEVQPRGESTLQDSHDESEKPKVQNSPSADLVQQVTGQKTEDESKTSELDNNTAPISKEKRSTRAKTVKRMSEAKPSAMSIHDDTEQSQASPQKSKENSHKLKPVNKSKKVPGKTNKKKVLSELTRSQQHKDTNSIPETNYDQNDDTNHEMDVTEPFANLSQFSKEEVKDSFKENKKRNIPKSDQSSKKRRCENDDKRITRKPGDEGYWSRVKIPDYNEKHKCTKCDVVLKSRKRYMEHMRRIHIKEFKCDVCERRFGYPTDLHRHKCPGVPDPTGIKTAKGGRPKKTKPKVPLLLPCPECDYIGTSKKRFSGHVKRNHHMTFPCDECTRSFGFSRDLQRHKDNVHAKTSYFCDKCSKFYKSKSVFNLHSKTHEKGYVKPSYDCKVCDKSFTTRYVLSSHTKTEHLGIKRFFLCQICGKKFSQRNSYKQHLNAHAGVKPYKCDICPKAFTYHKSLKEHKFMHDNIRRFQCQLCEKAFRQRTTLQIHMKVHKTIKDHICLACGKGFAQKQALERHERIHTGVKPYKCIPCQRKFGDSSTIRRHMVAIHQKNETNWRDEILCTVKKKTDYYVLGGSGQNRTYKSKSNTRPSSSSSKNHEETSFKQDQPISELSESGTSIIVLDTQEPGSGNYKNDYSSLQNHEAQQHTFQSNAIHVVSGGNHMYSIGLKAEPTSVPQPQHIQTVPNTLGRGQVIDFSSLSQTVPQSQLIGVKMAEQRLQEPRLHAQPVSSDAQHDETSSVTDSPRLAPINSVQTSTATDATALGQTVGNLWDFVGNYQAYYNTASLQQFQASQNQQ